MVGEPGGRRHRRHERRHGACQSPLAGILPSAHDAGGGIVEGDGARAGVEGRLVASGNAHQHVVALAALHAAERRAAARAGAPPVDMAQVEAARRAQHLARGVAYGAARGPQRLGDGLGGSAPVEARRPQQALAAGNARACACFPCGRACGGEGEGCAGDRHPTRIARSLPRAAHGALMSGTRRSRADSTPIQRRFHALSPRFSRASRMCAAGLAGVAKACALHRALQAFRRAEPRRSGVPSSCPAFGRRARLEPFRRRPRVSRGLYGSAFRRFHDLVH